MAENHSLAAIGSRLNAMPGRQRRRMQRGAGWRVPGLNCRDILLRWCPRTP